jgi:Sulfocyanin (SoxE) domain
MSVVSPFAQVIREPCLARRAIARTWATASSKGLTMNAPLRLEPSAMWSEHWTGPWVVGSGRGWRETRTPASEHAGETIMTLRLRQAWIVLAFVGAAFTAGCGAATRPRTQLPSTPLPKMLSYNATAKTVVLTLVPGAPGMYNGYNYDGYGRGTVLIDVPVGWRVTIRCINDVATGPHSCAIIKDLGDQTAPVFPAAATPDPHRGVPPGHSAEFSFIPRRPGGYRIASLIAGEETAGMWDAFAVTQNGRPSITVRRPL